MSSSTSAISPSYDVLPSGGLDNSDHEFIPTMPREAKPWNPLASWTRNRNAFARTVNRTWIKPDTTADATGLRFLLMVITDASSHAAEEPRIQHRQETWIRPAG